MDSDQLGQRAHREIEAVWRIEAPKLIAALAHLTNDVGTAEELAQDALVAALEQWPTQGTPAKPGAWLLTAARRRGIDQIRRNEALRSKYQLIGEAVRQRRAEQDLVESVDAIEDDILRLIFIACHPVLPVESRIALSLRLLGGLSVEEIAAAFLVKATAMAARITRAKKALRDVNVEFELPIGSERTERLPDVLQVIYLIFNEGYSSTAGEDWMRLDLTEEALRLGRMAAHLMPDESEVHGLVALMSLQASRSNSRVAPNGSPILLLDQDRRRWDYTMIGAGLAALDRAHASSQHLGPYTLQASIAACHSRARTAAATDWARIAGYYDLLRIAQPSPIVDLNRAVAVGRALGPQAGLDAVNELVNDPRLGNYHLLPSTRGYFLAELGRGDEAVAEFEAAIALTDNATEQRVLRERVQRVRDGE